MTTPINTGVNTPKPNRVQQLLGALMANAPALFGRALASRDAVRGYRVFQSERSLRSAYTVAWLKERAVAKRARKNAKRLRDGSLAVWGRVDAGIARIKAR